MWTIRRQRYWRLTALVRAFRHRTKRWSEGSDGKPDDTENRIGVRAKGKTGVLPAMSADGSEPEHGIEQPGHRMASAGSGFVAVQFPAQGGCDVLCGTELETLGQPPKSGERDDRTCVPHRTPVSRNRAGRPLGEVGADLLVRPAPIVFWSRCALHAEQLNPFRTVFCHAGAMHGGYPLDRDPRALLRRARWMVHPFLTRRHGVAGSLFLAGDWDRFGRCIGGVCAHTVPSSQRRLGSRATRRHAAGRSRPSLG